MPDIKKFKKTKEKKYFVGFYLDEEGKAAYEFLKTDYRMGELLNDFIKTQAKIVRNVWRSDS